MSKILGYDARKQKWTRCTAANPAACTNHSVHQGQEIGLDTVQQPTQVENPYLTKTLNNTENAIEKFRASRPSYAGTSGDSHYSMPDYYTTYAKEDIGIYPRPADKLNSKIYDIAKEALGENTNIVLGKTNISSGSIESGNAAGTVTFGTSYNTTEGIIDRITYNYEMQNGNVNLYKKSLFKKTPVTQETIQKDIAKARDFFGKVIDSRGGM